VFDFGAGSNVLATIGRLHAMLLRNRKFRHGRIRSESMYLTDQAGMFLGDHTPNGHQLHTAPSFFDGGCSSHREAEPSTMPPLTATPNGVSGSESNGAGGSESLSISAGGSKSTGAGGSISTGAGGSESTGAGGSESTGAGGSESTGAGGSKSLSISAGGSESTGGTESVQLISSMFTMADQDKNKLTQMRTTVPPIRTVGIIGSGFMAAELATLLATHYEGLGE
jgi:hypothetical protein